MSDAEIAAFCVRARWGDSGEQVCSHCGAVGVHYPRRKRRRACRRPSSGEFANPQWKCKDCYEIFSVTSHSLFHQTQLSLRQIVLGIVIALGGANGKSSLELSSDLGVAPKTAFLFLHRLREAMADDGPQEKFKGIAQMDGGYFGGKPRKANRRRRATNDQLKRRFGRAAVGDTEKPWVAMGMSYRNWAKRKNKRVVLVVTDSSGEVGTGAKQVSVAVSYGEHEIPIRTLADVHIEPGSMVLTDEAAAYNILDQKFEHYAVRHEREYCSAEGVNDNHCEAFFSRLRRAEYGIYHGMRPLYLHLYAWEAAWRHNTRLMQKKDVVTRLLAKCLSMGPSGRFRGYYAGKGLRRETLLT